MSGSRDDSHECFSRICISAENGVYSSELRIDGRTLYYSLGSPTEDELDLLLVCSLVYAVDKLIPRKTATDGWQRHLRLELPVKNVELWSSSREVLEACLRFLTGDLWEIGFVNRSVRLFHPLQRRSQAVRSMSIPRLLVPHVTLLSGGLDSLIGVIDLLESKQQGIVTVSHHDRGGGDLAAQDRVLDCIKRKYPGRLYPIKVYIGITDPNETSRRSRSLLFLGLACYAALRKGINQVMMPENGMIALNFPLTPSRRGSCSTRTAHPCFVNSFNSFLASLNLNVQVRNPYIAMTKGQMAGRCRNQELLAEMARESVSCGKVGRFRTWARHRENVRGCGCCIPCLYRRAALHAIAQDIEKYGMDVCSGDLDINSGKGHTFDFRDLLTFLKVAPLSAQIRRNIRFTGSINEDEIGALTKMATDAREELLTWLRDKTPVELRQQWGI